MLAFEPPCGERASALIYRGRSKLKRIEKISIMVDTSASFSLPLSPSLERGKSL